MAQETPDIRVLVGVEGNASIDGASGRLILNTLASIAKKIKGENIPRVTFGVDVDKTRSRLDKELRAIAKSIKNVPIDLTFKSVEKEMSKSVSRGIKKGITNYSGTDQIKSLGKIYAGDRSKTNPIDNITKQLSSRDGVANVGISGKNYFEGQKEQLKSFIATVTMSTGEVQKLNFELSKIGKRKGFVQTDDSSFKFDKQIKDIKKLNEAMKQLSFLGSTEQETKYNSILNNTDKLGLTDLKSELKQVELVGKKLKDTLNGLIGNTSPDNFVKNFGEVADTQQMKELLVNTEKYYNELERIDKLSKKDSATFVEDTRHAKNAKDLENLITTMKKYEKTNDKFKNNSALDTQFQSITQAAEALKSSGKFSGIDIDQLRQKFIALDGTITDMGFKGQTAFGKLRAQMEKLGIYFGASAIMMGAARQVKQTISTVIELDKVVTDLSVATGMNRKETQELLNTYSELGKDLGATTGAVAQAGDDWLRQGKSIATTNKLIRDSLMLSKLGKIDSSEATTALTTMSKAYKITDDNMTSLVDKLTAVDAVSATTAGGIAKSFQETAVSANLAGISIDRMAGYIATVSEVSGDAPESVGKQNCQVA